MSNKRRFLITLCLLVSFLSFSMAGFLTLRRFSTFSLYAQSTVHSSETVVTQKALPSQLVMPDVRIDLPIIPARLEDQQWQLNNTGVSLLQSPLLSDKHGLILYGHNWSSLLGSLHQTKIGQKFSLVYSDGNIEHYVIQSILTVSPDRLDVLDLAKEDALIIYTCTGFLDTQRLVVIAHR